MPKNFLLPLLFLSSMLSVLISVLRIIYTNDIEYVYMNFNLALAWIPLILSLLIGKILIRKQFIAFWVLAFFWLLFFPNTLYLLTDFIHLQPGPFIRVAYDILLLGSFAINGLLLGFFSLYIIEFNLKKYIDTWIFSTTILTIASFGVSIGRYLRWNSWDLLLKPGEIFRDASASLSDPAIIYFTVSLSFIVVMLYWQFRPRFKSFWA